MEKSHDLSAFNNIYVKAAAYLIEQFHCHGYSIEQRLFILDVLSVSSLQLSNSHDMVVFAFITIYNKFKMPHRKEPINLYL